MNKQWTENRVIRLGDLQVNADYQRKVNMNRVRDIVENFNENLVAQLQVSERNGQYFVFDGQHTLKALALKFNDPDYPVVCRVYHGLTEGEEAKLYCELNICKKRIDAISMIKAQAFYGDPAVRHFLYCTESTGFAINPAKPSGSRYSIKAVKKAHDCFGILGAEEYTRMLNFIMYTWDGAPWSVSSQMLGGMTLFFRVFGSELKRETFAKRLINFNDDDIDREASHYYNLTQKYRYAWALGKLYNKKAGRGSLDLAKLNFVNY